MDWIPQEVARSFAAAADGYLMDAVEFRRKALETGSLAYGDLADDNLAEFFVRDKFAGSSFFRKRSDLLAELKRLRSLPAPRASNALSQERFEAAYHSVLERIIEAYGDDKLGGG